ncbi:unnamed protein product [Didymodactylos carnosus]|uniref:Uncharacterized protein n=1 Tax=Didymodactylos carnosus TaxID=1234261 RepID=A0A814Q7H9_9BILA|nr:unnamed protein product [Didymodactylos carnosus]CAF1363254.1 unnamed protein product [Didymodactylos carnosus]CAF3879564.1 unnamed protein product [Didymodactylos carnosus]CAF4172972.1 unnamed protein product [Didymodactylos carnosus]
MTTITTTVPRINVHFFYKQVNKKDLEKGLENEAAVAKANEIIKDIKSEGEAGLPELGSLSGATGRPIKILDKKGQFVCIIGEDKGGKPIEVEYHKPNGNNLSGHWTLPGGREPVENNTGENNCLFNVVAVIQMN